MYFMNKKHLESLISRHSSFHHWCLSPEVDCLDVLLNYRNIEVKMSSLWNPWAVKITAFQSLLFDLTNLTYHVL